MPQVIETVPISDLTPHPANPRQGDVGLISQLIQENGWYGSLLVQRSTGYILVGNHRYKAAKALGFSELPVEYRDCDDDDALRVLAGDNRASDLAIYDDPALADLLQSLTATTNGLLGTGWDGDDLDQLLHDLNGDQPTTDPGAQVDRADELQEKWATATDQVWQAGDHRLVCGDATDPATYLILLADDDAAVLITDPPYNVGIEYGAANDEKTEDAYDEFSRTWFSLAVEHSASQIVTPGGINLRHWICAFDPYHVAPWTKTNAMTRGKVAQWWCWEPVCFHGEFARGRPNDVFDHPISNQVSEGDTGKLSHPCPKPLTLLVDLVTNYTSPGQPVLDPFSGSGTTLVACEQTHRHGRGIELDPRYVAVTLERLSGMGLTPEQTNG